MTTHKIPASHVKLKRSYEPAAESDGVRILVDRLWPRGVSKANAAIDRWLKEIAPSTALRQWFGHDPARWQEFRRRYRQELQQHATALEEIAEQARNGTVTLLYGTRDEAHNNAVVLRDLLLGEGPGDDDMAT